MVVVSNAYAAAWDPRAKDGSFAARVNQSIMRPGLRSKAAGPSTAGHGTRTDESAEQGEALSTLPLPPPRWEPPTSTAAAKLDEARTPSPSFNGPNLATCHPDVGREASGNEADIQLPTSRFEEQGKGLSKLPLTVRTNQPVRERPHTARTSSRGSGLGGKASVKGAGGSLTARLQAVPQQAFTQKHRFDGSKAAGKKAASKEAWGVTNGDSQTLSITGSTLQSLQGVSARSVSRQSKPASDLTRVRETVGSATPADWAFRMPRTPVGQNTPPANAKVPRVQPPAKGEFQNTASVQILCLETPRSDIESVSLRHAASRSPEPVSKPAAEESSVPIRQGSEGQPATKEELPPGIAAARANLEKARADVVKYPLLHRVRKSRKPAGKEPSQPGAQVIPTRNSAGQIVGEVEIPPDLVNGEARAAVVPMVVDRNGWKGARALGPEGENARAAMRRASLQLWRNANGGYVVPSKPIVSDYADQMRWRPEEQDRLDITHHSRKSAFKELIEIELLYRQRLAIAKRDM